MREHMFSHYPDICGMACLVCRKPEKRKQGLMEHIERTHSPEVLVLFGIEYVKQYEVKFNTNSEEQVKLRYESVLTLLLDISSLSEVSLYVRSSVTPARTTTTPPIG